MVKNVICKPVRPRSRSHSESFQTISHGINPLRTSFFPSDSKIFQSNTHQVDLQTQKYSFRLEGTETILFVEDEDFIRDMIHLTLESKGYKVYTAEDGVTAIQLYERYKQNIDLVLTDIGLSGMTGIDEYKKLKTLNPEVKIIFTSGFLEPEVREKLFLGGAKAFIQKPYQPKNVL